MAGCTGSVHTGRLHWEEKYLDSQSVLLDGGENENILWLYKEYRVCILHTCIKEVCIKEAREFLSTTDMCT
jgi:hypothetical protein